MNFIPFTLRYPKPSPENLVYVHPDEILAFAANVTDRGVMGSIVYTTNPVAFHVAEDTQTIYDLIQQARR